jgi:hypothetical protein
MKNDVELFSASTVNFPFWRISGKSMFTAAPSNFSSSSRELHDVRSKTNDKQKILKMYVGFIGIG